MRLGAWKEKEKARRQCKTTPHINQGKGATFPTGTGREKVEKLRRQCKTTPHIKRGEGAAPNRYRV